MSKQSYVDIHILQTVPPSNLNRDDAGSPKQAVYGGQRRARVSSQAWKRATRMSFAEGEPSLSAATRTRKVGALLSRRITDQLGVPEEEAGRLATALLGPLGITAGRKAGDTAYLLFFGRNQLDQIIDLVRDRVGELLAMTDADVEKSVKELPLRDQFMRGHPADVALFGRMVADLPALNVDAATQVAHAISTHPVEIEFDYFTAVDDENPEEETGAGMIGTVEFNSATLYRYATVGLGQLWENLGNDEAATSKVVRRFVEGFTTSMPSGHQNSFAHRTLPSLVVAMVRNDQPVNLVGAYEKAIRSTHGIEEASAHRLAQQYRHVCDQWVRPSTAVHATYNSGLEDDAETLASVFGPPLPFPQVLDAVEASVVGCLNGAGT